MTVNTNTHELTIFFCDACFDMMVNTNTHELTINFLIVMHALMPASDMMFNTNTHELAINYLIFKELHIKNLWIIRG